MPNRTKYFLILSSIFLIVFSFFRVLFFLQYSYKMEQGTPYEVLWAFLLGIRFDLAVLGMVFGIFWVLSSIHFLNRFRLYIYLWSFPPILIFAWIIGHLTGDLIYFENANKHIGYEAFVFIGKDLVFIIYSFLLNDPLSFLVASVLSLLYLYFSVKTYKRFFRGEFESETTLKTLLHFAIVVAITVLLIRGGPQESPIRASDSIVSEDTFINNIALNGVFTAIMDIKSQKVPKSLKMDRTQATLIVRKEVEYDGAEWINLPNYPILRKTKQTKQGTPPNIVIIMLESWTGKYIEAIQDGKPHGKEVTPYFNQFIKNGHFFRRFFATGGRTTNGMISILTGIPDRPGLTAVRTHQILSNFSSIGNITKAMGYKTIFVNGDDLNFDNVKSIMPRWGFDRVLGKKHMSEMGKFKMGGWGYDDRDIYHVLEEEIANTPEGQPFLGVALTMTTHYPYIVPDKKFEIFNSNEQDFDFLNTYHYADWALHDFMESIRKSPRFDNTIFVFVGDHTHHRYLNYYEDRNIPMLLYAPKFIKPKMDNRIAGQIDILPTVLGLIGKETYFASMGKDLLDPSNKNDSAYFAYGNTFGWIEDNLFYFQFSDGPANLQFNVNPPHTENTICKENPLNCENHKLKARAFFNLGLEILNKDQIFPLSIPGR
ncbi:MAG: sulfatase-like hydrolase/transferase [Leptospira sp.]|nr:sulfatase-like hydrolase/transferase [Leptospira sp.]